ncbi:MAG: hypothetical protein ACTSR0_06985 [Candidatus Asgardarchaeia archaeon]
MENDSLILKFEYNKRAFVYSSLFILVGIIIAALFGDNSLILLLSYMIMLLGAFFLLTAIIVVLVGKSIKTRDILKE